MGHGQYSTLCSTLKLANIRPWPLVPFFQISLKNIELETTHNTFRDWHVHFFRQPFSKQLYTRCCLATDGMSNIVPRSPGCLSVNGKALAKQLDTFPSTTLVSNVTGSERNIHVLFIPVV